MKHFIPVLFALFSVLCPHNICGQTQRDSSDNIIVDFLYTSANVLLQNHEFDYRTYNKSSLSKQRARQSISSGLISVVGLNLVNGSLVSKYGWNLWIDVPAIIVVSAATMVPFVIWYYRNSEKGIVDQLSSFSPSPPDTAKAENINDILRRCSKQYGTNSVEYGRWMMICATICGAEDDLEQAEVLLNKGVLIIKQNGDGPFDGRDTADEIFMQDIKDYIEQGSGRDYYALRHCRRSTELKRQYFGPESKIYLSGLIEQSRLEAQRFHYRQSLKTHNEGYNAYVSLIKEEFCQRSENGRSTYWKSAKNYIYATVDLAAQTSRQQASRRNRPIAGPTYNALLLSKGLLLNTTIGFENHVKNSGVDSAIVLMEQRKRLPENTPISTLDSIDLEILRILREADQPYTIPSLDITWEDVQITLEDDDLAIEFFRDRSNNYGAVLLRKGWLAPQIVMLNNTVKIDNKYITLDKALRLPLIETYIPADADNLWNLSRAVWTDEIMKHFPCKREGRVYFSADGELQVCGIENLPLLPIKKATAKDTSECYNFHTISEVYNVHRLSSTRELVLQRQDTLGDHAAVFGGLYYDNSQQKNDAMYLKATLNEANKISEILKKDSIRGLSVQTYTGSNGTEENFKGLSSSDCQIIHVATHGFFNGDSIGLVSGADTTNPLSNSGLLLTGSKGSWFGDTVQEGVEDGILTALEISTMDLNSTDLVALSACVTGKGLIGEDGVFGLQRGFKMAGVQSIIMSLWNVDDMATEMLMRKFYENYLIRNMPKQEALRDAQEYVRNYEVDELQWMIKLKEQRGPGGHFQPRATSNKFLSRTNGKKIRPFQSPRFWSAFILLDALE